MLLSWSNGIATSILDYICRCMEMYSKKSGIIQSTSFCNYKARLDDKHMGKINFLAAVKNIIKNFWLIFSAIAALCLFLKPSLISLMITAVIFATVMTVAAFDVTKPPAVSMRNAKMVTILLTALIVCLGFYSFNKTWSPSSKVAAMAETLRMDATTLLLVVGAVGCIAGAYAIYILVCWIVSGSVKLLKERLPVHDKITIKANLKRNWYFPISAMAFFCLSVTRAPGYFFGLCIAFFVAIVVASQISSLWSYTKSRSNALRVLSITTAIGICLVGQESFYASWNVFSKEQALVDLVYIFGVISSIIGAIAAVFFVYFCVFVFWNRVAEVLKVSRIFGEVKTAEWIIYSLLLIASLCFMVFSFARSQVFYGTEYDNDIIYTSDSPNLVKGNAYLALTHPENDLRQPLFAVFAAPFTGIPYLVARLIGATAGVQAMLLNSVQIIMLFVANLMLAGMMKLDSLKRICFMLLISCTYMYLLSSLMMEQYIVAYFWLVLCLYLITEKRKPDQIALWGAGGTLMTSMVLLPFMSTKSPIKNFKAWFLDMVKSGLEFVALMLGFCRFDVIFNLKTKTSALIRFTGKNVTFTDKIYQYTEFIGNCFVAPNAGVNTTTYEHISWQLNTATGIEFLGVFILALAVFSAIWNRDKKSSLLAAGWVGFSVVMLLVLGWGTVENGLILYSLYFGWAFFVLLFQLVEKIESKLKIRFLMPVFTVCTMIALLIINIPAIKELMDFAVTYYPA